MRSNSKAVQTKIRKHIMDEYKDFGGLAGLKREVESLKKHNRDINIDSQAGARLVEGGRFLIATYDMEQFLNGLGINPTNKKYSDDKIFDTYKSLIGREVANILRIKR